MALVHLGFLSRFQFLTLQLFHLRLLIPAALQRSGEGDEVARLLLAAHHEPPVDLFQQLAWSNLTEWMLVMMVWMSI